MTKAKTYIYLAVIFILVTAFVLVQRSIPKPVGKVEVKSVQLATKVDSETNEIIKESRDFKSDDEKIYCTFQITNYSENNKLNANLFLLETDEGILMKEKIGEKEKDVVYGSNNFLLFEFKKPDDNWVGGRYYIIFFLEDEPIATIPFQIKEV